MWYGKTDEKLIDLYKEYYNVFKVSPDGYVDVEYGPEDYDDYVRDIKRAIKEKKELSLIVE